MIWWLSDNGIGPCPSARAPYSLIFDLFFQKLHLEVPKDSGQKFFM
jgi:hypothetical protein